MTTMNSSATQRSSHSAATREPKSAILFRRIRAAQRQEDNGREQVAAVCYRVHDGRLEFLLVQTRRGGRWTFPKGGVEPALTRSQSAALEALEEAGVHGSIEEAPFAQYAIQENASGRRERSELTIAAYLCAVAWLTSPHEANRNPTWFSPEKAKKRLAQLRGRRFAQELCRVVDQAVMRVERLRSFHFAVDDPLRRNHFEAPEAWIGYGGRHLIAQDSLLPALTRSAKLFPAVDLRSLAPPRKILQLGPAADLPQGRSAAMGNSRGSRELNPLRKRSPKMAQGRTS
jgi:8-oxo-dGTP pyrophosphatase MutT (NUDIX family)